MKSRGGGRQRKVSFEMLMLLMSCCLVVTTFLVWSTQIKIPSADISKQAASKSKELKDSDIPQHRLNIVDLPEWTFTEHELDTPIKTIPGKILDVKPPPQSVLMKPPTLRQVREQFKVQSLLPLSKPWGTVYTPNRIACFVPSLWPDHIPLLKAIADTWGALCDHLYFVLPADSNPPASIGGVETISIKMKRSGSPKERNIWEKMWRLWYLVGTSQKMLAEAEWFLKIDDDTFLSATNLKGFTRYLDPNEAWYLGHTIPWRWRTDNIVFNSGACYVISRAVVERLVPIFRTMPTVEKGKKHCIDRSGAGEDPTLALCLRGIGINPLNTLDENLRNRFLMHRDTDHESKIWRNDPRYPDDYYWHHRPKFMGDSSIGCCSEFLISSHSFKMASIDFREQYLRLNRTYNTAKNWDKIPLPPRPRWFLYDDASVDFDIDKFRNAQPDRGQRVHLNETYSFYCWGCKRGDEYWIEEMDAKFDGIKPVFQPISGRRKN